MLSESQQALQALLQIADETDAKRSHTRTYEGKPEKQAEWRQWLPVVAVNLKRALES